MDRSKDFETQHKLLLLETLYDAGLSLGSLPDEEALVEDVLVGDTVALEFQLSDSSLKMVAIVRHASSARCGFEFVGLTTAERKQIVSLVGRDSPAMPLRVGILISRTSCCSSSAPIAAI